MNAIVFTSNTGHTKEYAALFGEETGLSVYELSEGVKTLPAGTSVIFFGWLMAGQVKGYQKAAKYFTVKAVCGVGMGANGSQLADIRKTNRIPEETPVFSLQGGYEPDKLHGIYKLMMNTMAKTVGKRLAGQDSRTPEEEDMLAMLLQGSNRVCRSHLAEIREWYENTGGSQQERSSRVENET